MHAVKGAIAAGHEKTAEAARIILEAGGNAFDAGIAALLTTFITEPCMSSAAGGAFATVHTANGNSYVIDCFCQTPKAKKPVDQIDFYPIKINFGTSSEEFHVGLGSMAVPGTLAGIFTLYKQLATLPISVLLEPAITFAREGVLVNDFQRLDFELLESVMTHTNRGKEIYLKNNELIKIGDTLKMEYLADFLELIGNEGIGEFYKGEIGRKISQHCKENGGYLTREDFENYKVEVRRPLTFDFAGRKILTNPLPSSGGPLMALAMALLETEETPIFSQNSALHILRLYNAFKIITQIEKTPASLQYHLEQLASHQSISPASQRAQLLTKKWGSTTHFGILDEFGNAISVTTTNGEGSGYIVPGTDIMMNNMLGEAALMPNGFHHWDNDVRLSSMMSPTIVLSENETVEMVLGTGGAGRIPYALTQVLLNLIDYKMDLSAAINAPHVHLNNRLHLEYGFNEHPKPNEIDHELLAWKDKNLFFGGVHVIQKTASGVLAIGDDRRDGVGDSNL